ncbi:MAG TPA: dihydropteroate synthase [Candidatus Sphingobacterium stercoripullorum]|uniref:Dihydropteroate synthase n=1 Tax=Candidatus Sphingobacterium stercoripullorum TaxID=2838759 RepID=A0A9D2AY46_9SPHI|nr:dihydropteroate synthase [Candidatus Sphingobacterium stercoripullorum]
MNGTLTFNAGGNLIDLQRPKVMGILNLTEDSFFDGGRYSSFELAIRKAEEHVLNGADILDIGACSTRPGAKMISQEEEINRLLPLVEQLNKAIPQIPISIDTFRAEVAKRTVEAGASIINDISAGQLDSKMFTTIAELQVPYIIMHMRGTPETMQSLTDYDDLVNDIAFYFGEKVAALRKLGVKDIILDPGFGLFSKTLEQNYELLKRLEELHYFNLPILAGISRKSMIYKKLGVTPDEALHGTIALNAILLQKNTHILRVHDVKEAKELIKLIY